MGLFIPKKTRKMDRPMIIGHRVTKCYSFQYTISRITVKIVLMNWMKWMKDEDNNNMSIIRAAFGPWCICSIHVLVLINELALPSSRLHYIYRSGYYSLNFTLLYLKCDFADR